MKSKWKVLHVDAAGAEYWKVYRLYDEAKEDVAENREKDLTFDNEAEARQRANNLNTMLASWKSEARESRRTREKLANMECALQMIDERLVEMSGIASISEALIEAAAMPSEDALRTIVRALAYRLEFFDDVRDELERLAHDGLREPEAEEAEK